MATKFSIKDPNPGVYFKFDENDPDSGEIRIRAVNAAKRAEIQKKCVKKKIEYKHGQRFEYSDTNEERFSDMLWDYSIMDWNNLVDDDGEHIPCTKGNKVFLMQNNVAFAQFVGSCLEQMNEAEENRVSRLEKNSSSELND
jgi:hypothetical protein